MVCKLLSVVDFCKIAKENYVYVILKYFNLFIMTSSKYLLEAQHS